MLNRRPTIPQNFQQKSQHEDATQTGITTDHKQKTDHAQVIHGRPTDAGSIAASQKPQQTTENKPKPAKKIMPLTDDATSKVIDVRVKVSSSMFDFTHMPVALQKKALTSVVERARRRMLENNDINTADEPLGEGVTVRSSGLVPVAFINALRKAHDPHAMLSDNALVKTVLQHNLNEMLGRTNKP